MTEIKHKILRVNWFGNDPTFTDSVGSLGNKYCVYNLCQDEESWKTIIDLLNDTKSYYTIRLSEYLKDDEIVSDFNRDLVLHYFGLDINYDSRDEDDEDDEDE